MDQIITENEREALFYVKKHKELEKYFFKKIILKKEVKWMSILKEHGFFDKKNIPICKEDEYIEEWEVLNYVDSIVDKLEDNKNDLDYILDLLLQIAEESNNFRVLEQSIDILSKIHHNNYEKEYFEKLLNYWLNNKFAIEHILYYISKKLISLSLLSDKNKGFILFKRFLEKFVELDGENEHIIEELLLNDEIILKLTEYCYEDSIYLLIQLIEKKLECCLSERVIDNKSFKITKIGDEYQVFVNEIIVIKDKFSEREYDIRKIVEAIRKKYESVNMDVLEKTVMLLYGDLFIKDSYESIFLEDHYVFNIKECLISLVKKYLIINRQRTEKTCILLEKILMSRYDLIKKIGLFFIAENFVLYEKFLLCQIKNNTKLFEYIFRYYIFEDEVKHIFEKICILDEKYIEIINNIIEQGEYIKQDWEYDYSKLWKQKRYLALKNIPYFDSKYKELRNETGIEVTLAPAVSFSGVHTIEEKSPLTEEEIVQMSNEELVNNMINFREDRNFNEDFTQISYVGYGDILKKIIKSKPERFINDLSKFNCVQYEFVYYILEAFRDIINTSKIVYFNKIIKFINDYTNSKVFLEDGYCCDKNQYSFINKETLLKSIFWLIIDYLKNDENKFTIEEYSEIMRFLNWCFENMKMDDKKEILSDNNDYSIYFLNSLLSTFLRVIIELALKIKRCEFDYNDTKWNNELRPLYEKYLEVNCIDAYFLFGQFIGNLSYVDKKWVVSKLKSMDYINEEWEFFISGYLCSRVIYGDYFKLMQDNLKNALKHRFNDNNIKEKLAEHIVFAYLNGFDDEINLFSEMINKWDTEMIEKSIRTCCSLNKKNFIEGIKEDEIRAKVLNLWNSVIKKYKNIPVKQLSNDDIKIIKNSINLINNFDTIDKNVQENIKFSFQFLNEDLYSYSLIKYFSKAINNELELENKQITIELISCFFNECVPTYPEEIVKELLRFIKLNDKGGSVIDKIMQTYVEKKSGALSIIKYINDIGNN